MWQYRRGWNQKIVRYYDEATACRREHAERRHLEQERLYYWLDTDLKAAFDYSEDLTERAMKKRDTDLLEGISAELLRVWDRLTPRMRRKHEFIKAVILHRRERDEEAIVLMSKLLTDPDCEAELWTSAQARLVEFYVNNGDPQKAIEFGQEREPQLKNFLDPMSLEDPLRKSTQRELGTLCRNLGSAYQSQSKWDLAEKYYKKALEYYSSGR